MLVRQYTAADYGALCAWQYGRGFPPMPEAALSRIGLISPGVAAGFLYQTDSCLALIDSYLSNMNSDKAERDIALDAITLGLLNKAKELGFTHVKCETKIPSIGARAERLGFKPLGAFAFYVKEL